jgi:SAM-dependent methyltransferase
MNTIFNLILSILSNPRIYDLLQKIMGGTGPQGFVSDFIRPNKDDYILDLGCGTARILEYLPNVTYVGYDSDEKYIEYARSKYGNLGSFNIGYIQNTNINKLSKFDTVIMLGVLHHLDDESVKSVLKLIHGVLKPSGRLVTMDPTFIKGQSLISKILVNLDRGKNVRTPDQYQFLIDSNFSSSILTIKNNTFIPYTHCIIECMK